MFLNALVIPDFLFNCAMDSSIRNPEVGMSVDFVAFLCVTQLLSADTLRENNRHF